MDNVKIKIASLLKKKNLTSSEKKWLLQYLDTSNGSKLQDLLLEQFNQDSNGVVNHLTPEKSEETLENIHKQILLS